MAAYFIAQYVVNDPKLYREYQARRSDDPGIRREWWRSTSPRRPSREAPRTATVIVKFESPEAAKAWYGSPAYQAAVGKRLAATEGFAVIAQSMKLKV